MDDYRTSYATPRQIDSLWAVIGSLRKQVEDLTGRLTRVEAGAGGVEEAGATTRDAEVRAGRE